MITFCGLLLVISGALKLENGFKGSVTHQPVNRFVLMSYCFRVVTHVMRVNVYMKAQFSKLTWHHMTELRRFN